MKEYTDGPQRSSPRMPPAGGGSGLFDYDPGLVDAIAAGEPSLRIVSLSQLSPVIEELAHPDNQFLVLENQKQAYMAMGTASILPIQTIGQPPYHPITAGSDAQCCVKTGYVAGDDVFVTKVAAGGGKFAGNTGMLLLFSQRTMKLETMLCDEGVLTEMRTAAATCFATKLMKPRVVESIGFFGSGVQAVWQLRFLLGVFKGEGRGSDLPNVVLKTRSKISTAEFIVRVHLTLPVCTRGPCNVCAVHWQAKLNASPCDLDRAWRVLSWWDLKEKDPACNPWRNCSLFHTVTTNRNASAPLLTLEDVAEQLNGVHISAVGADSPGKQELGLDLIDAATLCVCDSFKQTIERGEFQHAAKKMAEEGGLSTAALQAKFVELAQVLQDTKKFALPRQKGSPLDRKLTIFDTSGVAVQDVQIAKLAASRL